MSKNNQNKLEPRLRFPEFVNDGEWESKELSEITTRITEKVGTKKLVTVSISASIGFVSQAAKFSRDISGQQYNNYIYLRKGDFAYNKGNSKTFPQGCIYKLNEFDEAAAPNAFICFRFEDKVVGDFFQGYFENNIHGKQLKKFITSGARMDGLLNVSASDFFSISFPTPRKRKEQQKIASCLSSLDEVITTESQKLVILKDHKKGLLQNLLPQQGETVPKFRFKEFEDSGEWEEKELEIFCNSLSSGKDKNVENGKYELYGSTGIIGRAENASYEGDYILVARVGANAGLLNKVKGKFGVTDNTLVVDLANKDLIDFIFYSLESVGLNKLVFGSGQPLITGGQLKSFLLRIPTSEQEQKRIAFTISSIDELVSAQSQKVKALKLHKKGLLQGLFPAINTPDLGQ